MARRILIGTISALAAGARTYTTWNPSHGAVVLGYVTLSGGNLTATGTGSVSFAFCLASQGMSAGVTYWETTHTFSSGTGYVLAAGIAQSGFNVKLGSNTTSASGPGQDGNCYYNNSATVDAGTVTTGTVVRHRLDMDQGKYDVAIGAGAWFTVVTGLTGTWYAAACFTGTSQSIVANFGASAFTYAVPSGAVPGIYTTGASTANPLYIASERVFTSPTATPANTFYLPRILRSSQIRMKTRAGCWVWGSSVEIGFGRISIANPDGALNGWADLIFRGVTADLRYGTAAQVLDPSTCPVFALVRVDRIEYTPTTVELVLTDKLADLEKALQYGSYDSTTPVVTLRDQPKPVSLGNPVNVDPVLFDSTNRRYDVSDIAPRSIDEVTDKGNPFVPVTDWQYDNYGFKLTTTPVGKIAATVKGNTLPVSVILNEAFTSWSSGVPTGWTEQSNGNAINDVYESPTGMARFVKDTSNSSPDVYIVKNVGHTTGKIYLLEYQVNAAASGQVRIEAGALTQVVTAAGYGAAVFAGDSGTGTIKMKAIWQFGADITFDWVKVSEVRLIEYLPDWLTELCVTRGGLLSTDLDSTSINALDAKAHYALAYFTRSQVNIRDVIKMTMDSFTGWLLQDQLGNLIVGRLEPPSDTPVLSLTEYDTKDDWIRTTDVARGLSSRMGGVRNWTTHGDSDFATSVSGDNREKLKALYQAVRSALGVVGSLYAQADKGAVQGTLLRNAADVQAEVSRVVTLYRDTRRLYTGTALLDQSTALALKHGDTVNLTLPSLDLAAGKNLLVVGKEVDFWSQRVGLELWG